MILVERPPFASIVLQNGVTVSEGDMIEFVDDATGEVVAGQAVKITGKKTTKILLHKPQTCQEIWYLSDISDLVVTMNFADVAMLD